MLGIGVFRAQSLDYADRGGRGAAGKARFIFGKKIARNLSIQNSKSYQKATSNSKSASL